MRRGLDAELDVYKRQVLRDLKNFAEDLPQRIPVLVAKIKRLPVADKIGVDSLAERSENMVSSTAQYLLASAPLWLSKVFDLVAGLILCCLLYTSRCV